MSKPSACRSPKKSTLLCHYITSPEVRGESRWCRSARDPVGARGTLSGRQVILASLLFSLPGKQVVQEGGQPSCRSARCPRILPFLPAAVGGKTGLHYAGSI